MKLNKNEQNYLLTILFKSYILQSVICSGIILVCTVSLDMGLTWVLDRYVEHYYLIYRGLYVYMVGLILWVVCILYLTYKLLKKVPFRERANNTTPQSKSAACGRRHTRGIMILPYSHSPSVRSVAGNG